MHLDHTIEPSPSYKVAKKFFKDIRPDEIVIAGDLLDFPYLAKWTKDTPLLVEGRRYQSDCDMAKRELYEIRGYCKKLKFLKGNHEDRVRRFVERNPLFEGSMNIEKDLGLTEMDIQCFEMNVVYSTGKLNFTHGWYWNKYHAMKHLNDMGDHIFYGHTHDHQVVIKQVRAKREPYMAMSMGCLCDLNPYWKRNRPNEWVNGFGYFEVGASGNFTPLFIPIIHGEILFDKHVWRAS
jgi:predicted phosphodiesterase